MVRGTTPRSGVSVPSLGVVATQDQLGGIATTDRAPDPLLQRAELGLARVLKAAPILIDPYGWARRSSTTRRRLEPRRLVSCLLTGDGQPDERAQQRGAFGVVIHPEGDALRRENRAGRDN